MHIYTLTLSEPEFQHTNQLLKHVSSERRNRIKRYHNRSDQLVSMYAELIARMGISKQFQIDAGSQAFEANSNGKPYLIGHPGIHYNLSHSKSSVLCAISTQKLGVDIEKAENPPYEIMEGFFHKEEIAYINAAAAEQRKQRFFQIWTRKEAYVKHNGQGLGIDLRQVNAVSSKHTSNYLTWSTTKGYTCSVYTRGVFTPQIINLTEQEIYNFYKIIK